jgi:hypothetical protein
MAIHCRLAFPSSPCFLFPRYQANRFVESSFIITLSVLLTPGLQVRLVCGLLAFGQQVSPLYPFSGIPPCVQFRNFTFTGPIVWWLGVADFSSILFISSLSCFQWYPCIAPRPLSELGFFLVFSATHMVCWYES